MNVDAINPGLILICGAVLIPLVRGLPARAISLILPLLAFWAILSLEPGNYGAIDFLGLKLETLRVDRLSLVFGYIFIIAAFLGNLFAAYRDSTLEQTAALIYSGSAVAAVFAGDLITLFVYWELTAVGSVFLIWASGTERAYRAGLRYLIIQVASGVVLLAGILVLAADTGSIAFGHFDLMGGGLGPKLIFLAFGIKCAFPLLHNWLQDAYPEATVSGAVILSAFTTKMAVYALARGFAGTEELIYIGALMTVFPVFYAVIENDLRRVLSYSLNNQLGFMVCGVGIGTEMAINGAAAHAFSHILYKALLFMSMGAVLHRTGTIKASELGGLFKSMPWTTGFCSVGALAALAFPAFSGFISKSLILTAAATEGHMVVWVILLMASASVMLHAGINIPFFAFFAHDQGHRVKEAPWPMLSAMAIAAALCIGIGVYPNALYTILPYPVDFEPYTTAHVITQSQLILFSLLAFVILMRTGVYPLEMKSTNLDSDWFYRKLAPAFFRRLGAHIAVFDGAARAMALGLFTWVFTQVGRHHGPDGLFARSISSGGMMMTVVGILGLYLLFYFV